MTNRTTMLAVTLVTAAALAVPLAGAATPAIARPGIFPSEWCGNQAPPCVVSASRNGVAITESDPTYAVSAAGSLQSGGEFLTQWGIADALIPGPNATLAPGGTRGLRSASPSTSARTRRVSPTSTQAM